MKLNVKRFLTDENGAVTVDWVVLTAAIVGLGMLVLLPIAYSTDSSASAIGSYIAGMESGYGN